MEKKKYLNIGSVMKFVDGHPFISLNNESLAQLVDFLENFGKTHLKGLSDDDIRKKTKSKEIPRISLSLYPPGDKSPEFVKNNVVLKLEE